MRKGRAFEMEAVLFGIIVACHLLLRDGSVWFIVVWKHTPAETYYIFLICTHAKTDGCSWYTANLCHWPFSGFQGTVGPWNLQKIAEDLRMALTKAHPSKFMQDGHDVGTNWSKVAGKWRGWVIHVDMEWWKVIRSSNLFGVAGFW